MQETSLKKRYIVKLFANIITAIINAVIIAIVPKSLGPIVYGQFIYLQDFFTKLISFLDLGTSTAFFTKFSANQFRKELITFYFLYSFAVLFSVVLFIKILTFMGYSEYFLPQIPINYIYYGLFFGFLTWFVQIFIKISDAYALTASIEIIKIIYKVLSLLLLMFLIYCLSFDLEKYFYFHYISIISFLSVLSFLYIKKGIFTATLLNFQNIQFKTIVNEFYTYCNPLVIYSLIGVFVGIFDIWLLQKVAGSEQTGFYGLSYSLAAMCFLFTSAMTPIITREFAKSYEKQEISTMRILFNRYIPMLYSIAAYFSIFISFQSENVVDIFAGENFKEAHIVLMIMAFYPIHQTYGQLSGSIFYATGQTRLYKNIGLFSMLIGAFLSFLFIYIFDLGAVGLALKMIIGQFIGVTIQLYYNVKFLDTNIKYFILHQAYSILFFAILAFISSYIFEFASSLISFLTSGFVYTIFVITLTYFFPQVFATSKSEIKENLKKVLYVIKR